MKRTRTVAGRSPPRPHASGCREDELSGLHRHALQRMDTGMRDGWTEDGPAPGMGRTGRYCPLLRRADVGPPTWQEVAAERTVRGAAAGPPLSRGTAGPRGLGCARTRPHSGKCSPRRTSSPDGALPVPRSSARGRPPALQGGGDVCPPTTERKPNSGGCPPGTVAEPVSHRPGAEVHLGRRVRWGRAWAGHPLPRHSPRGRPL